MDEQEQVDTIAIPAAAQAQIKEFRAQLISIQAQLQQFVDGVLIGMGIDINAEGGVPVDLASMTITVPKKSKESK